MTYRYPSPNVSPKPSSGIDTMYVLIMMAVVVDLDMMYTSENANYTNDETDYSGTQHNNANRKC